MEDMRKQTMEKVNSTAFTILGVTVLICFGGLAYLIRSGRYQIVDEIHSDLVHKKQLIVHNIDENKEVGHNEVHYLASNKEIPSKKKNEVKGVTDKKHKCKLVTPFPISRYWNCDMLDYFKNDFKQVEILTSLTWRTKISIINRQIWLALLHERLILVVTSNGHYLRIIRVPRPTAMEEAINGDIFICTMDGLFVLLKNKKNPQKLKDGRFADVARYGSYMPALDYYKKAIMTFIWTSSNDKIQQRWFLNGEIKTTTFVSQSSRLIAFHKNASQIYIVSQEDRICVYENRGTVISSFGYGTLVEPFLNGMDDHNQLLISDRGEKALSIVNMSSQQGTKVNINTTGMIVYDATIDEDAHLWTTEYNIKKKVYSLVKYELV